MENLRKRAKVSLINHAKDYKNMLGNQVLFQRRYLIKTFVAIHETKPVLTIVTNLCRI